MTDQQNLPLQNAPTDSFRLGARKPFERIDYYHPVLDIQQNEIGNGWNNKIDMIRRTYGSHMAMRIASENKIFQTSHRLPGLESSKISYDTVTGRNLEVSFTDILNGKLFLFWIFILCNDLLF